MAQLNGESGSVKVADRASKIINQYKHLSKAETNPHQLVFSCLQRLISLDDRYEVRKRISFTNKRLNKIMNEIMTMIGSTKNASQHKARHSFAQRAEEKEIQRCYRKCTGTKAY